MESDRENQDHSTAWWVPGKQLLPLPIAVGLLIVLTVVLYLYAWPWIYWTIPAIHPVHLPGISDHWHADYVIKICDQTHPPLMYTLGDIHTHGNGQIHVHPSSPATAGKQSNLGAFFDNAGGTLTTSRIAIPPLLDLSNGDRCKNGKKGELTVYVNETPIEDPPSYVPRDGDSVIIYFGPTLEPPALPVRSQSSE